jgi:UV DNA damage endonuclease
MKLGLCCICETLKESGIKFQTMTRKSFLSNPRETSIEILGKRILNNIEVTDKIIKFCVQREIWHYRLSSSLFPLIPDKTLDLSFGDLPNWKEIENAMKLAGDFANNFGISLSCHPDQFNVLASYSSDVVDKTIRELNFQSWVLDKFQQPQSLECPMCLHVALSPRDELPEDFAKRFLENLGKCHLGVRTRIVLENEDSGFWNAANLLKYFSEMTLVFDNLHFEINNPDGDSPQSIIDRFKATWGDDCPVFHFSEGTEAKPRSHTDYASDVPQYVLDNWECVWEVELKGKEKAIFKIMEITDSA